MPLRGKGVFPSTVGDAYSQNKKIESTEGIRGAGRTECSGNKKITGGRSCKEGGLHHSQFEWKSKGGLSRIQWIMNGSGGLQARGPVHPEKTILITLGGKKKRLTSLPMRISQQLMRRDSLERRQQQNWGGGHNK